MSETEPAMSRTLRNVIVRIVLVLCAIGLFIASGIAGGLATFFYLT